MRFDIRQALNGWVRRYRPALARFSRCLVCFLALQGCCTLAVSPARRPANGRSMANVPMMIRTLGVNHRFSRISSPTVAERLRGLRAQEPLNILALSGGGAAGAFGAGAVAGLTRSGARPEFRVVTGVSVGALIAPYAFLGSTWDARLLEAFTSDAEEHLLQPRGLSVLFGSSLYSGGPLKRLIDAYVSDTMIEAVAREWDRGRLLLVATTDVASGEPVVWDMGAIAKYGGPSARVLFRDVLVASASVPGMFPPVVIRVQEDGMPRDEVHVDGGATMPFFVPAAFVQAPGAARNGASRASVYIIVDGPLVDMMETKRWTTRAVLAGSIRSGLNQLMMTTLELTAATAELQGATLHYTAIPASYPHVEFFDLRARITRPLLRYGYGCAEAGRLWTVWTRAGDDGAGLSRMDAQVAPCPADDASPGMVSRAD
jgi:predicted acylesterase/phospholipase RssA